VLATYWVPFRVLEGVPFEMAGDTLPQQGLCDSSALLSSALMLGFLSLPLPLSCCFSLSVVKCSATELYAPVLVPPSLDMWVSASLGKDDQSNLQLG
jgi:hypothetical protein